MMAASPSAANRPVEWRGDVPYITDVTLQIRETGVDRRLALRNQLEFIVG
jgi:hypothetical protein